MKMVPLARCIGILMVGLIGVANDASARSAAMSLRGPVPRAFPSGNQCLGVRCGLGRPLPAVTAPFVAARARLYLRRHHALRRNEAPYGVGFAYGGWPLASPEYVAAAPDGGVAPAPRGCYSQPYYVPSEDKGMSTVVVTRCYGM